MQTKGRITQVTFFCLELHLSPTPRAPNLKKVEEASTSHRSVNYDRPGECSPESIFVLRRTVVMTLTDVSTT